MIRKKACKTTGAMLGLMAMLGNVTPSVAEEHAFPEQHLTTFQKIQLLRNKVKYVFVIFHENELFDHYFGTFPGANGLFTAPHGFQPARRTTSFVQDYLDTSLNVAQISPFLMPRRDGSLASLPSGCPG